MKSNRVGNMIISIFNTKGGSGKTATATLLLSAIAEFNASSDAPVKTIVIDTDPQGTLSTFFARRANRQRPTLSIENRVVNLHAKANRLTNDKVHAILRDANKECDLLILDCAGSYDPDASAAILVSHLVIVPAALAMGEIGVALPIIHQMNTGAAAAGLPLRACLAINREEPIPSKSQKALSQIIEEEDVPRFETRVPRLGVIAEIVQHGLYLHEMQGLGSSEKSIAKSLTVARRFLAELSEQTIQNREGRNHDENQRHDASVVS